MVKSFINLYISKCITQAMLISIPPVFLFYLRPKQTKRVLSILLSSHGAQERGFSINCLFSKARMSTSCPFKDMQQNNTSRSWHPQEAHLSVFFIDLCKYFFFDLQTTGRLLITPIMLFFKFSPTKPDMDAPEPLL